MRREANNMEEAGGSTPFMALSPISGPFRMCLGCRERSPQSSLIRFSFHALSWVVVQPFSREKTRVSREKTSGRSAYVHSNIQCVERACISKKLHRAFRTQISREDLSELKETLHTGLSFQTDNNEQSEKNYG